MRKYGITAICMLCLIAAGFGFGDTLWNTCIRYYGVLTDKTQISAFIRSFGCLAPLVFIGFQILQVIFAPFPGELTGFVGGYLFGALQGFIYSSIGLTAGSWINFGIGRFLGKRFVLKHIPDAQLNKFERLLKKNGVLILFVLFVFPGFPKDYLCLFLGLTAIPLKIFILLTAIGRMPGTLLLSLQGAFLIERQYEIFAVITVICLILVILGYRFREECYRWVEKFNNK